MDYFNRQRVFDVSKFNIYYFNYVKMNVVIDLCKINKYYMDIECRRVRWYEVIVEIVCYIFSVIKL